MEKYTVTSTELLKKLCINHKWFTCGSNEQYNKLFYARLIALHDLDVPWRPADLEQRRGRMVRQGNINENVHLYRYVTKGTFDAYSYQLLEMKTDSV